MKKYEFNFKWILFLPISILLGFVPLITRLNILEVDEKTYEIFGSVQQNDFFSQFKATAIISLAVVMAAIMFLTIEKHLVKMNVTMKIIYGGLIAFILSTIVSTIFSEHSAVAVWGMFDRAEGMVTILAYTVIFFYTIYIINTTKDYKYIIAPLSFVIITIGIIGFFQYIGSDLMLTTEIGKKLIVPEKYAELRNSLSSSFKYGKIHGTLYHYNYVGSFVSLTVPFFITLMWFEKNWRLKRWYILVTLFNVWLLFGSTARSGLVGVGLSALMFMIIFIKELIKNKKWLMPLVAVGIIGIIILNVATSGKIFARIPSLINDAIGIFLPSDPDFNYKDHIPIRNLSLEGSTVIIEKNDGTLDVNIKNGLKFTDENGNPVIYTPVEGVYTTDDPRFNNLSFTLVKADMATLPPEEVAYYENINYDLIIAVDGKDLFYVRNEVDETTYFMDPRTLKPIIIEDAPVIGFNGKEKLGSARGYIWSRSLPMLMETLFIGNGPDTYVLEFPQTDYLGKWYAYNTINMIVDKPHNLYLLIGINQGGIALLGFIIFIAAYGIDSLRLYFNKAEYNKMEIMGGACFLSVVGYLGAGVFNDSVVSVAPIFWVLFGCGASINWSLNKQRKEQQKPAMVKENSKIVNMATTK
ncbi:hypothetical protein AN640_02015 [Candidatus Epulonipiscium fishelsonii]|uniref:Uncharacterized protein n=1 Tax=Candidatus Epulonipiscium fishelsonii TaxID=77094 RepID=A0ACC8XA31_9FIRM|nr:hypothetical protein AN640_02015 [Epulopiscium sp. SCG-D08WGA-EpuloA1]